MVVRIRLGRGVPIQHKVGKNRHVALAAAGLLIPMAVMSFALGVWRLAVDLSHANAFAIREGLFSHWHVWIVIAAACVTAIVRLERYGRGKTPLHEPAATVCDPDRPRIPLTGHRLR